MEFARHFGPAGQLCVVAGNCFFQVQRNCSSGKRSQVQMPCVVRSSSYVFILLNCFSAASTIPGDSGLEMLNYLQLHWPRNLQLLI